jgi:hypothetical protein
MPDILVILYTWDRYEMLKESLESMFRNPGMNFRLFVVENGSINSNLYGKESALKQLELLIDYYKNSKIDTLILNKINVGTHHAINQLMALARLISKDPEFKRPDFVFQSNDDMVFEDGWLKECYDTLLTLEEKEKVTIVSPFHCKNLQGIVVHGMNTIKTATIDGKTYEIKDNVSGNTWFMRGTTWIDLFDWYPTDAPNDGGDWEKLTINNKHGYKCAVTINELAHHNVESQGKGKYNRLGHW